MLTCPRGICSQFCADHVSLLHARACHTCMPPRTCTHVHVHTCMPALAVNLYTYGKAPVRHVRIRRLEQLSGRRVADGRRLIKGRWPPSATPPLHPLVTPLHPSPLPSPTHLTDRCLAPTNERAEVLLRRGFSFSASPVA